MLHRYTARRDADADDRLEVLKAQFKALSTRLRRHLGTEHDDESINLFEIRRILEDIEETLP